MQRVLFIIPTFLASSAESTSNTPTSIVTITDANTLYFVIVYLKEADDIVFRQYVVENNTVLLKPINTAMYKVLQKEEEDVILGVMVEARWQA